MSYKWDAFEFRLKRKHPVVQRQIVDQIKRDIFRKSLFKTCVHLLNYQDVNQHTHGDMISCLESETKRKMNIMPRGSLKSSIGVVAYSIWLLLNDPNLRILIDSQLYTNSKNFLREIRSHLESKAMVDLFGQFKNDTNWTEGEITIRQRTRVFKEASITCGGVGTVKVGQHYDVILIDDYNSDKNSNSREACQKIIDHYRMNTSILEPFGTLSITATRYSEMDLVAFVLENEVFPKTGLL